MSSRHFLTIFCRRRTDDADAGECFSTIIRKGRDIALTVHIEVVIWHILAKRNRGAAVVTEVKYPRLDTKPG